MLQKIIKTAILSTEILTWDEEVLTASPQCWACTNIIACI